MKTRVTPLNIASAILLVRAGFLLLGISETFAPAVSFYYYMLLVALCVISDLLFRSLLRNLKRIWIVELSFIIFVAIAIWIMIML